MYKIALCEFALHCLEFDTWRVGLSKASDYCIYIEISRPQSFNRRNGKRRQSKLRHRRSEILFDKLQLRETSLRWSNSDGKRQKQQTSNYNVGERTGRFAVTQKQLCNVSDRCLRLEFSFKARSETNELSSQVWLYVTGVSVNEVIRDLNKFVVWHTDVC